MSSPNPAITGWDARAAGSPPSCVWPSSKAKGRPSAQPPEARLLRRQATAFRGAGGEAAVGDADAGPADHRAHGCVDALGREDLSCGLQDAFTVAAGSARRSAEGVLTCRSQGRC